MRQRGRPSAERLAISVNGKPSRLATPSGLTSKERAEFEQLINAAAPEHFRSTDVPLLIGLVQATLLSRRLGRDPAKITEWERATRTMASLATRLRLTPQSRVDPKTIGRMQQQVAGPPPWQRDDDVDDDDEAPLQ